jgi:N-acylglucosamine-6-phosphate 2-epimerase
MKKTRAEIVAGLRGLMVISCQASKGEPLCHPDHILALALSGINGGAGALRLEGTENVAHVRRAVDKLYPSGMTIVGLTKAEIAEEEKLSSVYITPTYDDCAALASAGADIIALDATTRKRGDGMTLAQTIEKIHDQLGLAVWADCATIADGLAANAAGADIVSTTLYGYTAETALPKDAGPGFVLLGQFIEQLKSPVILEGRVWHPEELTRAFEMGAHAVVVGSAITRPQLITERFVAAIPAKLKAK